MAKRRRWIPIVLGAGVLLVFLGVAFVIAVTVWFQQNVRIESDASERDAESAFAEVRQRFSGRPPVLVFRDGRPEYSGGQKPAAVANPGSLSHMHVIAWDDDDRQLARVSIPFWVLRLKSGPIEFGSYASGFDDHGVDLTPEDLERFGPGILIDMDGPRGSHVLVWTQ